VVAFSVFHGAALSVHSLLDHSAAEFIFCFSAGSLAVNIPTEVRQEMRIISDDEAIRYILMNLDVPIQDRRPQFACYLGAGGSAEAGVKMSAEICNDIRQELIDTYLRSAPSDKNAVKKVEADLNWNDRALRYAYALKLGYPTAPLRVEYFRTLLRGVTPSFLRSSCLSSSHDLSLLPQHRSDYKFRQTAGGCFHAARRR
jgi:hypothetical protein